MRPGKVSGLVPKRSYLGTPATAPGPAGPQMLKAFGQIRNNPLMYLNRVWQEYGDVVQFPIPRPPTYLVVDPSGVERVLLGSARYYGKSTIQYRALSLVTGEGLLTADTEAWRRQRPMVQPAFHHESLAEIAAHIAVAIDRITDDWRRAGSGTVMDVDAAMMHGALEVVGHALFGTDLTRDAEQLASATLSALDVVIARARVPISPPDWVRTPANRILRRANGQLDAAVHAMLQERRAENRNSPSDMLDILLSVRDDDGVGLTDLEIRNQMVTFIVAGHETVASALTWAWGLLAANPKWQKRMQAEIDEVVGGRRVTFADYANLPVTRAIYDEVLRLYPPAWLITRKALVDDLLGGCEIPAGALIILSPYLLHRHPDIWEQPNDFEPDRFLGGKINRTAFIPFGYGPRLCVGRDFANLEGVLMLAGLGGRFEVEFAGGAQLPAGNPLVTIRPPAGMPLVVRERVSSVGE